MTGNTGAQTQATYDGRDRMITATQLVRQNTSAAYTTTYGYDDAGNQTSVTTPAGVTITGAYNPLGELVSSTDGAGNTTSYVYNLNGQLAKVTLPDGSGATAAYDQAGRMTGASQLSTTGTVLRTATAGYDADGNITASTDFRGTTTTAAYDPTGELTTLTQPVTTAKNIQLSYGYDLNGNLTQSVDGNGNSTWTTYNSRGLPQVITEPATARYTSTSDSTTTNVYDADGNLTQKAQPGGVQVTASYDSMGRLLSQAGTGATAATASRTYTYDTAGRLLTAATTAAGTQGSPGYQPATSDTFSWDDRGLLLAAAGSAGTPSFGYNPSGQLASAAGPAGTSTYTYDKAGQLATDADAASGTTGTYSYNNLGEVTSIGYGTGNDTQTFTYDPMHRLASDTITTAAHTQVAAISYGYDSNNDLTSMTTSGLAAPGGGTLTSTYSYDLASRLTSWTATPASGTATTTSYGYDSNGNLTSSGSTTYTYDTRDQLTSDSKGSTYAYTASGDLTAQTAPGGTVTSYTSDAYGQQITDAGSSYTWDALNRVIGAVTGSASTALTYSGDTGQLTSDGTATYSRDPGGALTGISSGTGRTIALSNQHGDLVGTFTPAGTSLASSATYDPWGQAIAASGPAVQVGYQGQWTDPATGQVSMGSRFYSPARGSFLNHDTTPAGNPYAYAGGNPLTVTDLTGHSPDQASGGSGGITQAQVDQAKARANDARRKAERAEAAAAAARNTEAADFAALNAATTYAMNMDVKAVQAAAAASEARQKADEAEATVLGDDITISSLTAQVALDKQGVTSDWNYLLWVDPAARGMGVQTEDCVYPAGGSGCDPLLPHNCDPYNPSPQCILIIQAINSFHDAISKENKDENLLNAAETTKKDDEAAYERLKSKADGLWLKAQQAENAATEATNAMNRAATAYSQAKADAARLDQAAKAAEQDATTAEDYYKNLLRRYEKQHGPTKGHPGHHPAPCSTACVSPSPPPVPIPRPEPPHRCYGVCKPGSSLPGGSPSPTPPGGGTTQPGESPSPSPGGSGQGSGIGGTGGQPPSCSGESGGNSPGDGNNPAIKPRPRFKQSLGTRIRLFLASVGMVPGLTVGGMTGQTVNIDADTVEILENDQGPRGPPGIEGPPFPRGGLSNPDCP